MITVPTEVSLSHKSYPHSVIVIAPDIANGGIMSALLTCPGA